MADSMSGTKKEQSEPGTLCALESKKVLKTNDESFKRTQKSA